MACDFISSTVLVVSWSSLATDGPAVTTAQSKSTRKVGQTWAEVVIRPAKGNARSLGRLGVSVGGHLCRSRGDSLKFRVAMASQTAIPQFPNESFLFLDFHFGI